MKKTSWASFFLFLEEASSPPTYVGIGLQTVTTVTFFDLKFLLAVNRPCSWVIWQKRIWQAIPESVKDPQLTQNFAVTLATSLHPLRNKEHNREIKTKTLALSFLLNTSRKKNEKPDGANEQNQHFFLCLSPLWRLWPKTKKKARGLLKKTLFGGANPAQGQTHSNKAPVWLNPWL